MTKSGWMYTGEVRSGMSYEVRPGVEKDRYARPGEHVWRYMRKERFLAALESRALYFTRISKFIKDGDRFEGSAPVPIAEMRESVLRSKGGDIETYRQQSAQFWRTMLQLILVNCWYKNEFESRQMWDRYGRGGEAVAILSTLEKLIASMPDRVTVGHVDYIDFKTHASGGFSGRYRAFQKSQEYEDEREVRAVIEDKPETSNGRWSISLPPDKLDGYDVEVDLSNLIEKVVISPDAPQIQVEVESALSAACIGAGVVQSTLNRPPLY